ncbi:MAG TPA: T9SS type A sorting domain-containing protein [Cytophagaceae bacterium]|jgi:hypothetical protein
MKTKLLLMLGMVLLFGERGVSQEVKIKSLTSCSKMELLGSTAFNMKIELVDTLGFDSIYFELKDDYKTQIIIPVGTKYGSLRTRYYPLCFLDFNLYIGLEPNTSEKTESVTNVAVYTVSRTKIVSQKATCSFLINDVYNPEKRPFRHEKQGTELKISLDRPISNLMIEIFNINGGSVIKHDTLKAIDGTYIIDISKLQVGYYMVSLVGNNFKESFKFSKD